jgi:hypothetical protein
VDRVGRLTTATTSPSDSNDWRFQGGRLVMEASNEATGDWIVVTDDFRVTNRYWHGDPHGQFVVPRSGCVDL